MDSCFNKIRGSNYTLYANKNFRNETFEHALLTGETQLNQQYHPELIPSSRFTKVYKFNVCFDNTEKTIYLKEYLCRSYLDFIKHLFRPSRAKRSLKATKMLQENGFYAPVVVSMAERKISFFKRNFFLATLEAENAKKLYKYIPDDRHSSIGEKRKLIRAFGQTIGRMHSKGIFHGDLRLGNILAKQDKNGWRFFFLDNERTKRFHHLPARLRFKNLVQVNMFPPTALSNTDRMRFFKEYRIQNNKGKEAELIKKVLKKTRKRLSKKGYV